MEAANLRGTVLICVTCGQVQYEVGNGREPTREEGKGVVHSPGMGKECMRAGLLSGDLVRLVCALWTEGMRGREKNYGYYCHRMVGTHSWYSTRKVPRNR